MAYLFDTNTFIQAKNEYYAFEICPGFWDWLLVERDAGRVLSIDRVLRELIEQEDDLARWAKDQGNSFFFPDDQQSIAQMNRISQWIHNSEYLEHAKRDFLNGADPFLIAYALAHGHTVVTHEVLSDSLKKIKIPNVCKAFHVPFEKTCPVLYQLGARFILQ